MHDCKDCKDGVADIKYSPNGKLMAVATFDCHIDIYNVDKGYARISQCKGHSSVVRGVDWSVDSSVIQTDSADLELLVWNARTGKQVCMGGAEEEEDWCVWEGKQVWRRVDEEEEAWGGGASKCGGGGRGGGWGGMRGGGKQ